MKLKYPDGSFRQSFHAVFDNGDQLTHWDRRRDNTLSSFWRSQQGQDLRSGKIPKDSKRFEVRSKFFFTPARQLKAA